jgi:hypothetical protein
MLHQGLILEDATKTFYSIAGYLRSVKDIPEESKHVKILSWKYTPTVEIPKSHPPIEKPKAHPPPPKLSKSQPAPTNLSKFQPSLIDLSDNDCELLDSPTIEDDVICFNPYLPSKRTRESN